MLQLPSLLLLLCLSATAVSAASIVSTADSRLPMSLSTVVSDLEAEGCQQLSTACLLTSRSVTKKRRVQLLEQLLDAGDLHNEQAGTADTWKAVAISSGFALAQPGSSSCQETASAACACGGSILYYADTTDLQRGEGLFDTLAPAIEKLLASPLTSTLYVLVDDGDESAVRSKLERAAASVLPNLISAGKSVSTLEDVFAKVVYLAPESAVAAVTADSQTTPADVAARVSEMWSADTMAAWGVVGSVPAAADIDLSPANLAAARKLGPVARLQLEKTVAFCKDACTAEDGSTIKLVVNFGELCDAALKQAALDDDDKSPLGKQIRANLRADLDAGLSDLFADQLDLLKTASMEEFKRGLSKLLISPNLQSDMEQVASQSVASFAAASKKLVPKSASSTAWNTASAKIDYARTLKEYVASRILAARASGKFKPLPRKGVTVGFHWLLPKPFGNDYRQEPWMVHATDNMVYVPGNKLADVNLEDVAAGDWRNKIVPSPAGNDMLYMQ